MHAAARSFAPTLKHSRSCTGSQSCRLTLWRCMRRAALISGVREAKERLMYFHTARKRRCNLLGLLTMASCAMASLPILAATDTGTLHVGSYPNSPPCPIGIDYTYGYSSWLGSYSPTGLTGGNTVRRIVDRMNTCGSSYSLVQVDDFSSDPGRSWLISVTCGGFTLLGASASYSYDNGTGIWSWTPLFGFIARNGSNVSCSITHD